MIAAIVASSQGRHHRRLCNEVIGSFVTFFSFSFLFLFCYLFFCAFWPLRFISFPLSLPLVFTGSNGHKSPQFQSHHLQFLGRKCLGHSLFAGLQAQHNPKRKHSSICGSPNPARAQHNVLVKILEKVAGEAEGESAGWKVKLIIFVGSTC